MPEQLQGRSDAASQQPGPHQYQQLVDESDVSRTAYTFSVLHTRKDATRITALALDPRAQRLFIGLSNGYVEEHQLVGTSNTGAPPLYRAQPQPPGTPSSVASFAPSTVAGSILGPPAQQLPSTRLVAGRKVSKHPVAELCCLPVAQRVVARCEDGTVWCYSYEGAELIPVPGVRAAVAIAGDGMLRAPARLAVAVKSGGLTKSSSSSSSSGGGNGGGSSAQASAGGSSKLLVFTVASGPGGATASGQTLQLVAQVSVESPVYSLAWVGDSVFLAVPGGYRMVQSGRKMQDIAPGVTSHTQLVPSPAHRQALLLFADSMVVAVDADGIAATQPILLGATGSGSSSSNQPDPYIASALPPPTDTSGTLSAAPPLALAAPAAFLVAVGDEGVQVYDRGSSRRVQEIAFAHDDAWVTAAGRMACADDMVTGVVTLATSTAVYCLQPVAPELQARELLKRRRYTAALDLISSHLAPHGGLDALLSLNTAPNTTVGTSNITGSSSSSTYTSSVPLGATQALGATSSSSFRAGDYQQGQGPRMSGGGGRGGGVGVPSVPPAWCCTAIAQAGLLLLQDARFQEGLSLLATLPPSVFQPHQLLFLFPAHTTQWLHRSSAPPLYWGLHGSYGSHLTSLERLVSDRLELLASAGAPPSSSPPTPWVPASWAAAPARTSTTSTTRSSTSQKSEIQSESEVAAAAWAERERALLVEGRLQVAAYLMQVRSRPGVEALDALDSLTTALLLETGQVSALEWFVALPDNQAALSTAVPLLTQAQRWHALARLRMARNHTQEALEIWEGLAKGTLVEAPPPSGIFPATPAAADAHASTSTPVANTTLPAPVASTTAAAAPSVPGAVSLSLTAAVPLAAVLLSPPVPPLLQALPGAPVLPHPVSWSLTPPAVTLLQSALAAAQAAATPAPVGAGRPSPLVSAFLAGPGPSFVAQQASDTAGVQAGTTTGAVGTAQPSASLPSGGLPDNVDPGNSLARLLHALMSGCIAACGGDATAVAASSVSFALAYSGAAHRTVSSGNVTLTTAVTPPSPGPTTLARKPSPQTLLPLTTHRHPSLSSGALATAAAGDLYIPPIALPSPPPAAQQQSLTPSSTASASSTSAVFSSPAFFRARACLSPESWSAWSDVSPIFWPIAAPSRVAPPQPVAAPLVVQSLGWLLGAAPGDGLVVLRARPELLVPQVLALLGDRADDVRWQYLYHLLYCPRSTPAAPVLPGHEASANVLDTKAAPLLQLTLPHQQQQQGETQKVSDNQSANIAHAPAGAAAGGGGEEMVDADQGLLLNPARSPELHTELALELLECISRALATHTSTSASGHHSPHDQLGLAGSGQQQLSLQPANSPHPSVPGDVAHLVSQQCSGSVSGVAVSSGSTSAAATGGLSMQGARGASPPPPGALNHQISSVSSLGGHSFAPEVTPQECDQGVTHSCVTHSAYAGHTSATSFSVHAPRSRLAWLQGVLHCHLTASHLLDPQVTLAAMHDLCGRALLREEVLLYSRLQDHASALRVLAVELRDIEAAIRYCKAWQQQHQQQQAIQSTSTQAPSLQASAVQRMGASSSSTQAPRGAAAAPSSPAPDPGLWLTLLELCLQPGEGVEPLYSEAVRVLNAPSQLATQGGGSALALDPQKVLAALPDAMPLHIAAGTLARMMGGMLHRRRQAQVLRNLYRAQNLSVRAEHGELCSQRVVVDEKSVCRGCHRPLGLQLFYRYPSGVILCGRCAQPGGEGTTVRS